MTAIRRAKPKRANELAIDDAEYARRLAAQGGHCALCPSTPKKKRLHADHDHKTGQVRALLCHRCNRNLPTWVTREWLLRAAEYLREPPEPEKPWDWMARASFARRVTVKR